MLWRCWLGSRKGIWPVKTEWWGAGMVICLERDADLHMAQLMPLPLTVSCFSKIQIGFTFLVPAHPFHLVRAIGWCSTVWHMCAQTSSANRPAIPKKVTPVRTGTGSTRRPNCPVPRGQSLDRASSTKPASLASPSPEIRRFVTNHFSCPGRAVGLMYVCLFHRQ